MAYHLQNKFENVDTIAKDSCFHFGYQGQVEDRDENDKPIMKDKYIESQPLSLFILLSSSDSI